MNNSTTNTPILDDDKLFILIRGSLAMAQRVCHSRFCDAHPLGQADVCKATEDAITQLDTLCATVRALRAENKRVYTPSICEALRLLDDAGYGKEVPNSLSEMIKKVLAQLEQVTKERDEARRAMMRYVEKVKEYGKKHQLCHPLRARAAIDLVEILESVSIQEQEKL